MLGFIRMGMEYKNKQVLLKLQGFCEIISGVLRSVQVPLFKERYTGLGNGSVDWIDHWEKMSD